MAPPSPRPIGEPLLADADQPARLARRIREGDAAAEAELVDRYRPGLQTILRRQVKDPAVAEDLCQEVFRIALPALRAGKLLDGEKLAAYLWGIARNLAGRERRVRVRDQSGPIPETVADPAPDAGQQLMARERGRLLRRALDGLPPRDRAVLTAFYLTDTPKETICRRIGVTSAQFDLIKWRALKRLLSAWRVEEGGDD